MSTPVLFVVGDPAHRPPAPGPGDQPRTAGLPPPGPGGSEGGGYFSPGGREGEVVLHLDGAMDFRTALSCLQHYCHSLHRPATRRLVFDASRSGNLGIPAISLMMLLWEREAPRGVRLQVQGISGDSAWILELLGLGSRLFPAVRETVGQTPPGAEGPPGARGEPEPPALPSPALAGG